MVEHIEGPLYYERMGRSGPVMAFVHPNPMDQSCWIFQMAHLSTWYRCIGIDIPGYGRSPKATRGLTMSDMAQACWEAIDDATPNERAILVGCSVGSAIAPYMYHLRPQRTAALVLSGAGFSPNKEHVPKRIAGYTERGIEYRWDFTFEGLSPAFRATPLAHFFATLFTERNAQADLQSIIYQFEAAANPDPTDHHSGIFCPTLILSGSEDHAHPRAFALKGRIPGCEMKILHGAGHACQIEQPWLFDRYMIEFLKKHRLFPAQAVSG
jgi:pimeloyl-ACP methyl ester carboxylesterase